MPLKFTGKEWVESVFWSMWLISSELMDTWCSYSNLIYFLMHLTAGIFGSGPSPDVLLLCLSAKSIFVLDTLTSENSRGLLGDKNFILGRILTICKGKKCDASLGLKCSFYSWSKALNTLKIVHYKPRIPCGKFSTSMLNRWTWLSLCISGGECFFSRWSRIEKLRKEVKDLGRKLQMKSLRKVNDFTSCLLWPQSPSSLLLWPPDVWMADDELMRKEERTGYK